MITLCPICNQRFSNAFKEGKCYICNDRMQLFEQKLKNLKIENFFKFFAVETLLPKDIFIREENVFDIKFGAPLKNYINNRIIEYLKSKGFVYKTDDYHIKIVYDYEKDTFFFKRGDVFIYGKYWKLKPNISQKRHDKLLSVEAFIGERLIPLFKAKEYYMHASGREDIDVTNIAGRPFVFELKSIGNLKKLKFPFILEDNKIKAGLYGFVPRSFVTLVSDSHFDKCYRAYLDVKLNQEERRKVELFFNNRVIYQRTPIRVLRRRVDKIRKRKVYSAKAFEHYIDFETEAGLYIKELISGDNGRTKPSISSLLSKPIKCKKLIVTCIRDTFIEFYFNKLRFNI